MFKNEKQKIEYWNDKARTALVGKRVESAEYVEDEEFGRVLAITLDDGTTIFPMRDDEGNGPGSLHMQGPAGFEILPEMN